MHQHQSYMQAQKQQQQPKRGAVAPRTRRSKNTQTQTQSILGGSAAAATPRPLSPRARGRSQTPSQTPRTGAGKMRKQANSKPKWKKVVQSKEVEGSKVTTTISESDYTATAIDSAFDANARSVSPSASANASPHILPLEPKADVNNLHHEVLFQ